MGRYTDLQRVAAKVDSPPRYLDTGSGGKLLRPENRVTYNGAPTSYRIRDALVSAGFMHDTSASSLPDALAASVFQLEDREYSIGGEAKALADLWPDLGILTLTDAGLECNYAGGAGTASQTIFGSSDLFAVANPVPGNTAVFDLDLVRDPLDAASFETRMSIYFDDGGYNSVGITAEIENDQNIVQFNHTPDGHTTISDALVNGLNRIAVSFTATLCSVSVNGGAVSSFVPTNPPPFDEFTEVSLFFVTQSVLHPAVSRLKKIRWFPLQTDLPRLSAL